MRSKKSFKIKLLKRSALFLAISAASLQQAYAGPKGGSVVGGSGSISQNGSTTTISQTTRVIPLKS